MHKNEQDPAAIRTAYDRWSETYDTMENPTRDLDRRLLPRLAPPLAGKTVVEVGAGTGKNSIWLATRCRRLVGLDFSAQMLARARTKLAVHTQTAGLIRCNVTHPWPVPARVADLVLINLVLEHVTTLESVFLQAARVLRPGGQLLISEFHPARILAGQGARIEHADGVEWVGSHPHLPQAYRAAAATAHLQLLEMAAWDDTGARHPAMVTIRPLPRLLTVRLLKRR